MTSGNTTQPAPQTPETTSGNTTARRGRQPIVLNGDHHMDVQWSIAELDKFLDLTTLYMRNEPGVVALKPSNQGSLSDILASAQVVEQIFDRVIPGWRTSIPDGDNETVNRWCQHCEAVHRTKAALLRQEEVAEHLGDNAPQLNAARLHPWVWDGARSLWQSGHYREAIQAASVKLNAETQNKVGRRDVSETDLFKQVFTYDAPQPGKPRLRIVPDDESKTFTSVHRGAMAFAEGCYAAIRNPTSHDLQNDLDEDRALEQLAAFSVLARWVDDAILTTTGH